MGIWIPKFLATFVLPLGFSILLLLGSLAAIVLGRARLAAALVAIVAVGLWLLSTQVVADSLAVAVEGTSPPRSLAQTPRADAILVLSGGVRPAIPPRTGPDLEPSADRLLHAARLYRAGKAPWVVASGGVDSPAEKTTADAVAMAKALVEWGVPRDAILLETRSRTTHENCVLTKPILEKRGIHSVLLVTSALHMRRALATCRSAGIDAIPSPSSFEATSVASTTFMNWRPESAALDRSSRTIWEILGFDYYRARGWIRVDSAPPEPAPRRQRAEPPALEGDAVPHGSS